MQSILKGLAIPAFLNGKSQNLSEPRGANREGFGQNLPGSGGGNRRPPEGRPASGGKAGAPERRKASEKFCAFMLKSVGIAT